MSEVLNPFYIFQVYSVSLWMWNMYYYYATCIIVISTLTVVASLYETIRNNNEIRKMAAYSCNVLRMKTATTSQSVNSNDLVPGDVIVVPEGASLPCDMILLSGSVIVNEAMLTGESIPVLKGSLPKGTGEIFSDKESEKHTLFGGTNIIQTRPQGDEPAWALVKNTGFLTKKGSLIRDILYPKEMKFKFYSDGLKFVGIMAMLAIIGSFCTFPAQMDLGVEKKVLINRFFDLITIIIPPALPAVMACGVVFAIRRLKSQSIFCISPPRINMAGQI